MPELPALKGYRWILLALIATPFLIYIKYVLTYAVNIPRQDDYDAILGFLVQYNKAVGSNKLWLLFGQHNEHRIFSSRLAYALYYHITGTINFRHIIFIDGVILSLLFLVTAGFIRRMLPGNWHIATLVLSICLFDLNNYENMNFAMAGMQNFGIVLLFAASLWGYGKLQTKWAIIAALLQAVAVFSSGNGLLAAFFLVLYTAFLRYRTGMVLSILSFALFVPLYYVQYQKIETGFFTSDPQKFVPYFMHCLGAHFSKELGVPAAAIMLLLMAVFLPVQRWFRFAPETLPIVAMLGFLVSSVAVMSVFRGNLPVDVAYSSRYFIYSHLITTIIFALFLYRYRQKNVRVATGIAMALLIFVAIRNYNDGSKMFGGFSYVTSTSEFDYPNEPHARKICEDACNLNIYCIDQYRKKIK